MSSEPPKVLRIKRKRNQDPLQALILEDTRSVKRSKPSTPSTSPRPSPLHTPRHLRSTENLNYLFKLSRTEDGLNEDEMIKSSILAESKQRSEEERRNFVIPPDSSKTPPEESRSVNLPNELANLVEDYITSDVATPKQRKRRGIRSSSQQSPPLPPASQDGNTSLIQNMASTGPLDGGDDNDDDEYVFDVYHLSAQPMTSANHPTSQIGFIRFFDDDEAMQSGLLLNDDHEDAQQKPSVLTDDEDSNAESFYQNDYPSDEDVEGLEELQYEEDGFEAQFDRLKIGYRDDDDDENRDDDEVDEYGAYEPREGVGIQDEEYFDHEEMERYLTLGGDREGDDGDDEGEGEGEDDEDDSSGQRNIFFASDEHDPVAIHRDRIFGKLEKMLREDNAD
ncbi:uncharacterized protein LODBEIA_P58870 [Lodderomyces beijingensis]|uniref:Transcription factor Iwr1 domain-containing protein n=1 Tax=Lodderomyces beijingensis TaxID=1775926 RepID=A0ABP0ZU53_9ASCO